MSKPTRMQVSEYLATTFRPDQDYVDGELKERNLGATPHGTVQGVLFALFLANRTAWGGRPLMEQRIQISPTRVRVADVCVHRLGKALGTIATTSPWICIEIVAYDQTLSDMQERVEDYLEAGVENIWIIDPRRRRAWVATATGPVIVSTGEFTVPESPVRIALADIYEQLDEMAAGR